MRIFPASSHMGIQRTTHCRHNLHVVGRVHFWALPTHGPKQLTSPTTTAAPASPTFPRNNETGVRQLTIVHTTSRAMAFMTCLLAKANNGPKMVGEVSSSVGSRLAEL